MNERGSKYEPQVAGSSSWDSTSVTEERNSGRRIRATGGSSWDVTLWIGSVLKQDLILFDSLWPTCADELWQHLAFRDVVGDYHLIFESPTGVRTTVPFSSLRGFVRVWFPY